MIPGYLIDVKYLNDGAFLNVDTVTKYFYQRSVLDEIRDLQKDSHSNDEIIEELVPKEPSKKRITVITLYNCRIY